MNNVPPKQEKIPQQMFNSHEASIIEAEIQKLLDLRVLKPVVWDDSQFISPIFLRPKKNNEYRMILNLKKFNEYVPYQHFKMDTFETALLLVRKDMYMCTADIRHAYYSVPVATEHQKYFRLIWRDQIFQYTAIPNGYRDGPRLFTKLLKPVYAKLRTDGHICTGFIDDSLLGAENYYKCLETLHMFHKVLKSLGFIMNEEKSVMVPSQKIVYLGFILDSVRMIVILTQEKMDHIVELCTKLRNCKKAKIRDVAQVTGLLVSSFSAVDYGKLFYRKLEKEKSVALNRNYGNFDAEMIVSSGMREDLDWWIGNVHSQVRVIDRGNPDVEIQTDSSLSGWGVVFENQKFGGRWTAEECGYHINILELMAIFFALKALADKITGKHVKILSDSTTAVCYINNMGGIRSDKCNEVSKSIWLFCMAKDIWLSCAHIPGTQNEADKPSRQFKDNIEWGLRKEDFNQICCIWQKPEIDLFASRLNNKLPVYCSWQPDPFASYIDAFTIDWGKFTCSYIFPPFSTLGRCIRKVQTDEARAILIAPLWPTQGWFPLLLTTLVDNPVILPRATQSLVSQGQLKHPMSQKLVLIACKVSGVRSENEAFLKQQPALSCHHGEIPQNASMKCIFRDGYSSVIDSRLIQYQFLYKML